MGNRSLETKRGEAQAVLSIIVLSILGVITFYQCPELVRVLTSSIDPLHDPVVWKIAASAAATLVLAHHLLKTPRTS